MPVRAHGFGRAGAVAIARRAGGDRVSKFIRGGVEIQRYWEYTAGQPLTVRIDEPHNSTTGKSIRYEWMYGDEDGEGRYDVTPIATTNEPFLTFTPLASDHRRALFVDLQEEGSTDFGWSILQILLDRARDYPQLPKVTADQWCMYSLHKGESVTLSLPEATARSSGKTLEYRWYYEDGGKTLYQTTTSPKLTVVNDDTYDQKDSFWRYFWCEVGYKGEEETFLEYGNPDFGDSFGVCFYPFTDYRLVVHENPKVPDAVREKLKLNSVTELELYMLEQAEKWEPALKSETTDSHLYGLELQILNNNGKWVAATEQDLEFWVDVSATLPYPKGTEDYWNYDFTVAHMFEDDLMVYQPEVTKTHDGLHVRLYDDSPVLVAWQRSADAPPIDKPQTPGGTSQTPADKPQTPGAASQTQNSVPKTGDTTPLGALTALLALSACAMVSLVYSSRKKRA